MPQGFAPHPGGMQQPHPGVPPGHHMAPGMAHNPSQPGSQPGGIPAHLAQQMGVSAPGGQVNPSLMGMHGAPNAHAMQHLNPQVQHMFGQQPVNCESSSCAGAACSLRPPLTYPPPSFSRHSQPSLLLLTESPANPALQSPPSRCSNRGYKRSRSKDSSRP